MTWETLNNRNVSQGVQVIFQYANDITSGIFMRMVLLAIWCIVTFGLYFNQRRINGSGDFPASATTGSFVLIAFSSLIRLISGLIDNVTFGIILVLGLVTAVWFFFSRD